MNHGESFPALRALLAGAIDYAGLFPPAALSLETAVTNYGEYRTSSDRWALGRFVVPAARLPELDALLDRSDRSAWAGTRISATAGASLADDLARVAGFNRRWPSRTIEVDAVEARVGTAAAIDAFHAGLPAQVAGYGEVPLGPNQDQLLDRLQDHRLNAKIRMGGVTADLFPRVEDVAEFLRAVTQRQLPFKATAGLHHPLRGVYCLTYDDGSPAAPMYGFLNLVVATLVALDRAPPDRLVAALLDTDPSAIVVEGEALRWRDRHFDRASIDRLRALFHGFGSCSFREPIDGLAPAVRR